MFVSRKSLLESIQRMTKQKKLALGKFSPLLLYSYSGVTNVEKTINNNHDELYHSRMMCIVYNNNNLL
jgi:hypothetical protein